MRELTIDETLSTSGGKFKIALPLPALVVSICTGLITMGPAGLGIALCGAVMYQGVDGLQNM